VVSYEQVHGAEKEEPMSDLPKATAHERARLSEQDDELRKIVAASRRIVFFGGAGVSTESGIPDFRSESGLYSARAEYGHSPEYLVSRAAFERETELFYRYYRACLLHPEAKPNPAHYALAQLEASGRLAAVVTQNVDGLHQLAGSKAVHELHGSVHRNVCVQCGARYDLAYFLDKAHCHGLKDDSTGTDAGTDAGMGAGMGARSEICRCASCGGIVKPDVVLYGEQLDPQVLQAACDAVGHADTLIVGGTSLVVYPAAGLVGLFKGKRLVVINIGTTERDQQACLVIHRPIGEVLSTLCA
jgi:NAD-dependent deacetylase